MQESNDGDPREVFRRLGADEPSEIRSRHMWRRLEGALSPGVTGEGSLEAPPGFVGWLTARRRALATAATIVLTVAVWAGVRGLRYESTVPAPVDSTAGALVLLASPSQEAASPAAPPLAADPPPDAGSQPAVQLPDAVRGTQLTFDIRLVRGFEGSPPADALVAAVDGAGAVDRLADLDATLRAVLPYDRFVLVGEWLGVAQPRGVSRLQLSARFAVEFSAEPDPETGALMLRNMRLIADGRSDSTSSVVLVPGALYVFGASAEGSNSGDDRSLALAIRLNHEPE